MQFLLVEHCFYLSKITLLNTSACPATSLRQNVSVHWPAVLKAHSGIWKGVGKEYRPGWEESLRVSNSFCNICLNMGFVQSTILDKPVAGLQLSLL